ncbi:MAG: efflux RND transporter permease subunit, partial [Gammaproteobacteria bacterium]|nr:efflux RND transporter permease subunit [Gammaproteobacteria bacterium]
MNPLDLPVRRPVAVSMVFLGLVLLGLVAWQRIPIELFPNVEGDRLWVNFSRPGSEPETVEREILLPLEGRVAALPMVLETSGSIRGAGGNFQVLFERGVDIRVRELELRRIAAAIEREQPEGTWLSVSGSDTSTWGTFVMMVNVLGGDVDRHALFDVAEELIAPRFAAVPGVTEAITRGGAPLQVTLTVDPARAVALGATIDDVIGAVQRNVGDLRYLGKLETPNGNTNVVLDGRPSGIHSLAESRIVPGRPAQLHHAGEVDLGIGVERSLFRVNGKPSVGIAIYQEQGANLVRLGRDLRTRASELNEELSEMGLELVIGTDAAQEVEDQIGRLARLGLSGFAIALVVLYLFLRQWQAVTVVAVAVPISLLSTLAALYLFGDTVNMLTLFGLALAVGLLVDNSVVVFESVQRSLDHGAAPDAAVRRGLRRTVRAIAAASLTTAIVFLPLVLVEVEAGMTSVQKQLEIAVRAFLVPLAASLLVAVALVPMLAHRLAAPAAARRLARGPGKSPPRGGVVGPGPGRQQLIGDGCTGPR